MCALRTDYFPPSNRRRCVKSRPSYADPSDLLLSGPVHQDQSRDSFSQNEDSYVNSVESDDGEEEPITIDLSAFLNENPLLAQSAFECSSENNVAATESSSQFRVTDCKINTSEIPRTDVTNAPCAGDVNEVSSVDSGAICEEIKSLSVDEQTTIKVKDTLSSPEKVLSDVINNAPIQNIILNGNKTSQKKFPRPKALGFSNVLKKYKNFLKSKDLNKTNEKVFGKYPVVKCEKLDIENFVKNNNIKVCNWPLNTENRITVSPVKKKANLSKSTIKPKFIRKHINVNKYLINSNKSLTENTNNVLKKQFASVSSKPIIIRTNPWKPEVANTSSSIPSFLKNFVKSPQSSPKKFTSDLLKVRDENIKSITVSPPENGTRKSILVNNVNKLNRSKNYTLIAPKPIVQPSELILSSPSKPVIEIPTEPIPFNFTVIEPYVDDPSSPQKPKPILTVPIEVLSPEKQMNDNNLGISTVHSIVENSESPAKLGKSVFMNGVFKQICSPSRITRDICVIQKESNQRKVNQENHLMKLNSKISDVNKEKDSLLEENSNILKAKNVVVDAMQSAFTMTQKKKKVKPKTVRRDSFNTVPEDPLQGSTAYSSILNDNLLHGFSENDFEDVSPFEDASFSNTSLDILISPKENVLNQKNVFSENSDLTLKRNKNARKRKKTRRKKPSHEESSFTSDTLSASECENENNSEDISKKRKASIETLEQIKSPPDTCKKIDELDSVKNTLVNHAESKDLIGTHNKVFDLKQVDSSLPLCNLEKHVTIESPDDKINDKFSSIINKKSETQEIIINKTSYTVDTSPDKKCSKVIDNALETCTRTLRERKCSSTEVDKLSDNSLKQTINKNLQEKNRIKGSINSKLKIQLKSPRNTNNGKRKSSKPEDIIQEIKTITGGFSKKEFNKYKRSIPSKKLNSGISIIKDESESNSSCTSLSNSLSPRSFSKRKKTLKVCIKQSRKKKKSSSLKMPLNSLSDVVENANSSSTMSENNSNLHSSFREGKCEKMDTPQKDENSSEKNTSLDDSCMDVDTDENFSHEDSLSANDDCPVVGSPKTLFHEDVSCVEIVSNSASHLSVMSENKDNDSKSSTGMLNQELQETNISTSVESDSGEKDFSLSVNCKSNEENIKEKEENIDEKEESTEEMEENIKEKEGNTEEKENTKKEENAEEKGNPKIEEKEKNTLGIDTEDSVKSPSMPVDGDSQCCVANSESVSNNVLEIKIPVTTDDSSNATNSNIQDLTEKIDNDVSFKATLLSENIEKDCKILESTKENNLIVTEGEVSSESTKEEKSVACVKENISDIHNVDVCKSENDSDSESLLAFVSNAGEPLSEQNNELKNRICTDFLADNSQTKENEVTINSLNVFDCNKAQMPSDTLENNELDSKMINKNEEESINNSCKSIIFDILSEIQDLSEKKDVSEPCKETMPESTFENITPEESLDASLIDDNEQISVVENSNEVNETDSSRETVLNSDKNISDPSFKSKKRSVNSKKKEGNSCSKPKKCPKLKISFKKPDADSPDSLKNWFVSESKESEETCLLNTSSCGVSSKKVDNSVVGSKSSVNNECSSFSDESLLPDDSKKIDNCLSPKISLVGSLPSSDKSVPNDSSDLTNKIASENLNVIIKEEPMDYEENDLGSEETKQCSDQRVVSEPGTIKRPRRSLRPTDTKFLDFDTSEKIPRKVKLEVIDPVTPHSRGRKSKNSQVVSSTPKSTPGKRKNYDPELVCLPFSMGWSREHVIRATGNGKQSDVYYFTPEGIKLRSMPDILAYLTKHPNIKLTNENFTFAKELIYREPFETERGAKQASLKVNATPKSSGKGSKKLKSPAKDTSVNPVNENNNTNESPSMDTKKKIITKRKSSSTVDIKLPPQERKSISKNLKQKTLTQYLNENSEKTEDKLSRPSRKIVKKVPFDNSIDKNGNRKLKSETAIHQNSKDNIKIKIKTESKEEPKKVTLVSEQNSDKPASHELKETEIHNSKSSVPENSEICVKKSPSVSVSDDMLLSRTSIKSPVVKNRLKVRLAPKKPASVSAMHKPCTRYCNFAFIREPTVKCCICLCLFHPECIPFKQSGLTKYACVPCVVTQLDKQHKEREDELFFPGDFDIEMLYPEIELQLLTDPSAFSALNKSNPPISYSAVYSVENKNASHVQPPKYTYENQNRNYMYNPPQFSRTVRNICPSTPQAIPRQTNRMYFSPPISFPVTSPTTHKDMHFKALIPVQNDGNALNQGAYIPNRGSLPLLQNFSNSFFVQNQPCNKPDDNSPFMLKTSTGQFSNKPFYGLNVKSFNPHAQSSAIYKSYPNQLQNNTQMNNSFQNIHGPVGGEPILKTMLQNNYPNPAVMMFVPPTVNADTALVTNSKDSSTLSSNTEQVELINDKRKNDTGSVKSTKKIKSQGKAENSTGSSSISHKDSSTHLLDTRSFNTFIQFYECLNFIFKFLNVCDLLRASMVSKSWKHLASQKLLWEKVSFSGISIKDWNRCCRTLQKCETKSVDFRGMHGQDSIEEWKLFSENLHKLYEVEELIFEKVPPFVIVKIAQTLPHLKRLICYCLTSVFTEPEIWSTPCDFELAALRGLGRIEVIKISSMGGIHLRDNQQSLMPYLPNLTHVVLTGFKFNSSLNLESLFNQQQLIALELGDCTDIEPMIYNLLEKMTSLQSLCLQNGGSITDEKLPGALLKMNKLRSLELMNFRVSCHLSDVLTKMNTLQHFSLWPDTSSEAPQVNFNSYKAATSCSNLKRLCWGILTEDDDTVPNELELKDNSDTSTVVRKLSFEELFQSLVKHYPGVKVEVKCLPRSIWTEFCSSRNVIQI